MDITAECVLTCACLRCSFTIQTRGSACPPQHASAVRARRALTWTPAVSAANLSLAVLLPLADDPPLWRISGVEEDCDYPYLWGTQLACHNKAGRGLVSYKSLSRYCTSLPSVGLSYHMWIHWEEIQEHLS